MSAKIINFSSKNKRRVPRAVRFMLPPPPKEVWDRREWDWWPQLKPPRYDLDGWWAYARSSLDSYLHTIGLRRLRTLEDEAGAVFSAADVPYLADFLVSEMLSVPAQAELWYDPHARAGQPGTSSPREAKKAAIREFQGRKLPLSMLRTAANRTARNLLVGCWRPHRLLSTAQRRELTAWLRDPARPEPDFGPATVTDEDRIYRREHGSWPPLFKPKTQRAAESGRRGGEVRRARVGQQREMLLDLPAGLTIQEQAYRVGRDERTVRRWWDALERDGLVPDGSHLRPPHGGARCVAEPLNTSVRNRSVDSPIQPPP